MKYVVLKNKEMPWGDYGSMLLSGMACHRKMVGRQYQVERTGPFMPPIVNAGVWRFIVSETMRKKIVTTHQDVKLYESIKAKITTVNWHTWDLKSNEPEFYPDGGEPENYILCKWHSMITSRRIGKIYQFDGPMLSFGPGKGVEKIHGLSKASGKVILAPDVAGHRTIFREDFADWLVAESDGWVTKNDEYTWEAS